MLLKKWNKYKITFLFLIFPLIASANFDEKKHEKSKIIKKNRDLIRVQKSVDNTALVQALDNNINLTLQSVTNSSSDLTQRIKAKKDLVRQSPDMNNKNKICQ